MSHKITRSLKYRHPLVGEGVTETKVPQWGVGPALIPFCNDPLGLHGFKIRQQSLKETHYIDSIKNLWPFFMWDITCTVNMTWPEKRNHRRIVPPTVSLQMSFMNSQSPGFEILLAKIAWTTILTLFLYAEHLQAFFLQVNVPVKATLCSDCEYAFDPTFRTELFISDLWLNPSCAYPRTTAS